MCIRPFSLNFFNWVLVRRFSDTLESETKEFTTNGTISTNSLVFFSSYSLPGVLKCDTTSALAVVPAVSLSQCRNSEVGGFPVLMVSGKQACSLSQMGHYLIYKDTSEKGPDVEVRLLAHSLTQAAIKWTHEAQLPDLFSALYCVSLEFSREHAASPGDLINLPDRAWD